MIYFQVWKLEHGRNWMENRLTAMEAELAEIKGMKDLTDKKPEKTTSWLQPTVVTEQPRDAVVDNFVLSLIERVD